MGQMSQGTHEPPTPPHYGLLILRSLRDIPSKYPQILISLLLVITTLSVYWPVSHHDFVNFDDNLYIYDNPYVKKGLTWDGVVWAFSADLITDSPHADFWIPVTFLSHLLTVELFGLNPSGHHVINLVLHLLNTLLLFRIFSRMTGALWPSAFVAVLFAIHPLHVESVAWITERKDVLSTFFWMLTLWAYFRYTKQPTVLLYGLVMVTFALGLMSKPMLVTLPFALLLLDYWPLGRISLSSRWKFLEFKKMGHLVLEKVPLFILSVISGWITFLAAKQGGAMALNETVSMVSRIANALVSYATYIRKMVWPHDLAVFYPHPGDSLPEWKVVGGAVLLVIISSAVASQWRTRKYLLTGWLWYLGTLIPVIGVFQTGAQAMADRYTYVPLIGVFIMLAWGIPDILERRPYGKILLTAGAPLLILICLALTWRQVGYWRNSVTLFEQAIRVTEQNVTAHINLGMAYQEQGRFDKSIQQLQTAITVKPDSPMAHNDLGFALSLRDQTDAAIEHYRIAIRLNPRYAKAHLNLGSAYIAQDRMDEAIEEYRLAIAQQPDLAEAHNNLGMAYKDKGLADQAIQEFRTAIRLNPDLAGAYNNLGISLMERGMTLEAVRYYQVAVELKPDFAQAHNNLGESLTKQGRLIDAIDEFQMVIELEPLLAQAHNNLANVFFLLNRFQDAVRKYEAALDLDSNPSIAYNLGIAYQRMGRFKEARQAFEQASAIDPEFEAAQQALRHLPE